MMVKWANDGLLQVNDGKTLVNDGEMLVNYGEMSLWYTDAQTGLGVQLISDDPTPRSSLLL